MWSGECNVPAEVGTATLARMNCGRSFRSSDLESVAASAGAPDPVLMHAADRMIQRERKAGRNPFSPSRRLWEWCEPAIVP